ncbi:MAG: alpha/beta fold hydrolase [Halobacteriovoraceae bacterium]|jgi:uncharacterized protein|nr:alpha/beta fold hydrolase [Halobacteriovoraceae bacterium]
MNSSNFKTHPLLKNGHIGTLATHFGRKVADLPYERQRINTPDDDFLDLDWIRKDSQKLIILSHGLEGSSRATYIQGMMRFLVDNGFDGLAWNCRGCSGEPNKQPFFYHSGASYDLETVVEHVLKTTDYKEIYLIGFSLGGNITLKYLGEKSQAISKRIKKGIAFSVPTDLGASAIELDRGFSQVYMFNFLWTLKRKIRSKRQLISKDVLEIDKLHRIQTFHAFDDLVTAPLHGFENGLDYYAKSSSKQFIPAIKIPTLLVNAKNDPFLGEKCYPLEEASKNPFFTLEIPQAGGHVGFFTPFVKGELWSERRALEFIQREF